MATCSLFDCRVVTMARHWLTLPVCETLAYISVSFFLFFFILQKQCWFGHLRSCDLYIKSKTAEHWAGFVETCFVILLNLLVDVFTQPKHIIGNPTDLNVFFFLFMILLPADTRIR